MHDSHTRRVPAAGSRSPLAATANVRHVLITSCHVFRASHQRSYDEFVRKTIRNDSAPPSTTCASDCRLKSGSVAGTTTVRIVHAIVTTVTTMNGPRMNSDMSTVSVGSHSSGSYLLNPSIASRKWASFR